MTFFMTFCMRSAGRWRQGFGQGISCRLSLLLAAVLALGACSSPDEGAASNAATSNAATSNETTGLAGSWTLTIDTPRGQQHPVLAIVKSGAGYSATYDGRQGSLTIDEVTSDGNRFSFPLSITVPIGTIDVSYEGVIDGDTMTGVVQNPRGQVPFSGKRTQP